jgi:hypothetical protein
MNGLLLALRKGGERRTARQSLSGFRAGWQKSRLMLVAGMRLGALAVLLAMAGPVAGPIAVASAADSLVGGDRPDIRTPRIAPSPGVQRPDTGAGSSAIGATSNCRSRCGSACQTMSCSGLNTSQCLSIRQNCRMNCSSRC